MTKDEILPVIENYNSIFGFGNLNTSLMVCEQPERSLKCLSLDVVEIYAYIIIQKLRDKTISFEDIHWSWKRIQDRFYFFVFPDTIEETELKKVSGMCQKNTFKNIKSMNDNNYVSCIDEINVYKTCIQRGDEQCHACPFETDILLTINRGQRNLDDLNLLSQIICYLDINSTLGFLETMIDELKKIKSKAEQKDFLKGISEFVEGIDKVCKEVSEIDKSFNDDISEENRLRKIIDTCQITADLFQWKFQMKDDVVELGVVYSKNNMPLEKAKEFFGSGTGWSREKKVRRKSCNSVLDTMGQML